MDVPGSGPVVRGGREAGQLEARIDTLTRWAAAAVVLQKRSIRRFVITEKAPTRAFSWLKAVRTIGWTFV